MSRRSCCLDEPLSNLGRQAARADEIRDQGAAAPNQYHDDLRHPRSGGGVGDLGPDRGHARRGVDRSRRAASALSRPKRRFTATFLGLTNLIDGKISKSTATREPGKIQTKKGLLSFIPAPGLKKDQAAVISIRPENIPLYKEKPAGFRRTCWKARSRKRSSWAIPISAKSRSEMTSWPCIPIRFNSVSPGDKVYLQLDPASCNGLPGGR